MWVEHKAKDAEQMLGEPIPQELIDVLQHIILSHHGEPEFGCAQDAVHARGDRGAHDREHGREADDVAGRDARRGAGGREGNWTEYMKAFGGRLYPPGRRAGEC